MSTREGAGRIAPFPKRLADAVAEKGGPVVVGLDPRPEWFPPDVLAEGRRACEDPREAVAWAVATFSRAVIDAVRDVAAAVKPQVALDRKSTRLNSSHR